jgi:uncharacterized protein (DUF58 family)
VAGAVGLWLVLEWYGQASEVSWLFLLAAWVLALLAVCFAYALWNRAGLRLSLAIRSELPADGSPIEELPESLLRGGPVTGAVFEGDGLVLEVGLGSSGSARGPAWVAGAVAGKQVYAGTGLVPARGWRRDKILRELRRGVIGASGWMVGSSDPLGFFRSLRPCPDVEVTLVLPRFATLAGRRQPREPEAGATVQRAGAGNELFGIREYRPGDSRRRIHWRSSARHGELIVRDYEPPGQRMLALFLDPSPPSDAVADQIARIAASEAWDCIREGGRVSIWAPGREPSHASRDLWSQLEWLARYPQAPSSGLAAAAPQRADEVVVVTAGVDRELLETAERSRNRRGWVVGNAEVDADIPFERVGTGWPL